MKKIFGIIAFVILSSFVTIDKSVRLENGDYKVELDKEYTERGLNNFEFTLEGKKFIYKLNGKVENLEIISFTKSYVEKFSHS